MATSKHSPEQQLMLGRLLDEALGSDRHDTPKLNRRDKRFKRSIVALAENEHLTALERVAEDSFHVAPNHQPLVEALEGASPNIGGQAGAGIVAAAIELKDLAHQKRVDRIDGFDDATAGIEITRQRTKRMLIFASDPRCLGGIMKGMSRCFGEDS